MSRVTHAYSHFGPCIVTECVAVCCYVLQCVAVCCCVLQCVAVCCSVLQRGPRVCQVKVYKLVRMGQHTLYLYACNKRIYSFVVVVLRTCLYVSESASIFIFTVCHSALPPLLPCPHIQPRGGPKLCRNLNVRGSCSKLEMGFPFSRLCSAPSRGGDGKGVG